MYDVLYDATAPLLSGRIQADILVYSFAAGLIVGIFLLIVSRFASLSRFMNRRGTTIFISIWLGLWALGNLYFGWLYYSELQKIRYALSHHTAMVVEGKVQQYVPWKQHVYPATLTIAGTRFQFWGNISEGLFDCPEPLAIAIGDVLRVTAVGDMIVKVEERR